jgi:glutathione S-transferase
MTLTVYGVALSPFVRKVRVFLAEKGLDYKLEQVSIFPPPDL